MVLPIFVEGQAVQPVNPDKVAAGEQPAAVVQELSHAVIAALQDAPFTLAPYSSGTTVQGGETTVFEGGIPGVTCSAELSEVADYYVSDYVSGEHRGEPLERPPVLNEENIEWIVQRPDSITPIIFVAATESDDEKAALEAKLEALLESFGNDYPYFDYGIANINPGQFGNDSNGNPALTSVSFLQETIYAYKGGTIPGVLVVVQNDMPEMYSTSDHFVRAVAYFSNSLIAMSMKEGASANEVKHNFYLALIHELTHAIARAADDYNQGDNIDEFRSKQNLGVLHFQLKPGARYAAVRGVGTTNEIIKVDLGYLQYQYEHPNAADWIKRRAGFFGNVSWQAAKKVADDDNSVYLEKVITDCPGGAVYRILTPEEVTGNYAQGFWPIWLATAQEKLFPKTSQNLSEPSSN